MSLTIDFRHIVQEDAMTILSYASPYNVQLELVNGNNKLRSSGSSKNGCETSSPKPGRQSPLVHPLVRSSSQSDLNTVWEERFWWIFKLAFTCVSWSRSILVYYSFRDRFVVIVIELIGFDRRWGWKLNNKIDEFIFYFFYYFDAIMKMECKSFNVEWMRNRFRS